MTDANKAKARKAFAAAAAEYHKEKDAAYAVYQAACNASEAKLNAAHDALSATLS